MKVSSISRCLLSVLTLAATLVTLVGAAPAGAEPPQSSADPYCYVTADYRTVTVHIERRGANENVTVRRGGVTLETQYAENSYEEDPGVGTFNYQVVFSIAGSDSAIPDFELVDCGSITIEDLPQCFIKRIGDSVTVLIDKTPSVDAFVKVLRNSEVIREGDDFDAVGDSPGVGTFEYQVEYLLFVPDFSDPPIIIFGLEERVVDCGTVTIEPDLPPECSVENTGTEFVVSGSNDKGIVDLEGNPISLMLKVTDELGGETFVPVDKLPFTIPDQAVPRLGYEVGKFNFSLIWPTFGVGQTVALLDVKCSSNLAIQPCTAVYSEQAGGVVVSWHPVSRSSALVYRDGSAIKTVELGGTRSFIDYPSPGKHTYDVFYTYVNEDSGGVSFPKVDCYPLTVIVPG